MKHLALSSLLILALGAGCGPTCPDGTDASLWYADLDGDGHGDPNSSKEACDAPWAHVATPDDCDDRDPKRRPGRIDGCNGIDDDCDGLFDEDGVDEQLFRDLDGDGVGSAVSWTGCGVPPSPVYRAKTSGDCDDLDRTRRPGASERCNGLDDDCDGEIDEGAIDVIRQFQDLDGDGYGVPSTQLEACPGAPGAAPVFGDCDDTDDTVSPAAAERCNGRDDNCNGYVDEQPVDGALFYVDVDDDGWGGDTTVVACEEGVAQVSASELYGYYYGILFPDTPYLISVPVVASAGDCADLSVGIHPLATETCDGIDNDCDGLVDDADPSLSEFVATRYHLDADGDGWGRDTIVAFACVQPPSFVAIAGDCDDDDDTVKPYATERCDGIDNDCDGLIDGSDLGPAACP